VAENKKLGDVGTKQRDGEAIIATAKIEAQNQRAQNEQRAQIAMSNKELELIRRAQACCASLLLCLACMHHRQ
jgi:ABC-type phosphate/phosphonate transport system ATPase subunit